MLLSDFSVRRPIIATVFSLLLIIFGLVAFDRLSLREYPNIDPPVVSISTTYQGAAAAVVETRVTQLIESRIGGVEGIAFIESISEDGRSRINIEFRTGHDVDAAANDIRDRVAGIIDNLPSEADPPEIQKVDSDDDVILWLSLFSDHMSALDLTDYSQRYLVDRFSVLDGVARVRIGGGISYAMRIWLDRSALAARGLTVNDVEDALRAENVELPAGSIESIQRQFTARVERSFRTPQDFRNLVLKQGSDGYLVRLGDVAMIEKGAAEERILYRGNGIPRVGVGIVKQSQANTLSVAQAVRAETERLNQSLPEGMELRVSYDTSVFVESAIVEVFKTLAIAIALVMAVIYLFLGSFRAMLVPAVTVPVSLLASCIVLYALGFTMNLLTLLALVLAIGLVVDDAIVVLENIHRRIERGETPLVAAFLGTRQVGFAVIATTLVLLAVFVPLAFTEGSIGRLFSEFALTMAAAVAFSSFVALSLSPMLASRVLRPGGGEGVISRTIDRAFDSLRRGYEWLLGWALKVPAVTVAIFFGVFGAAYWLHQAIPNEYVPREDRGAIFLVINGPEGASYEYTAEYVRLIEQRVMPYVERGEATTLITRAPRAFGGVPTYNTGIAVLVLDDWSKRRSGWVIMDEIAQQVRDLTGVRTSLVMRQALVRGLRKPVQFVIGGGTYEELAEWRDILLEEIEKNNPGLTDIDHDYKETKPQLQIDVDLNRAGDLGVTIGNIGRTLETILGSRRVTTYIEAGEEYDVLLEGQRDRHRTPSDISNIFVRSDRTGQLIPLANLVTVQEYAGSRTLNRYNRLRAITIEANLTPDLALGEALEYLEDLAREHLPASAVIDYKGQSREYLLAEGALTFVFLLGIVVVFLVLAAQFESFVHPLVIILTVPLAMAGALLGMYLTGGTLNLYTQIGLIMLVGLAAKNGILIVEFVNQLRESGREFRTAIVEAAGIRLRPILMTAITTAAGSTPLILSFGAGAETRSTVGVVVASGIMSATLFTLFVVPVAYSLIARRTAPRGATRRRLEAELQRRRPDTTPQPPGAPAE